MLRYYQEEAVHAIYRHLEERNNNPCVVVPTGGGKTHILATVCRDAVTRWNGRVLILAHVKELLEQAHEKLQTICPDVAVGIHSAGLRQRATDEPVIVAGIQSVYKIACDLGPFDLIIIDEAHLIPPDGEGRYRTFLQEAYVNNPNVRVIGLTATPYRMKTGTICDPDNVLNHICYDVGVRELIVRGYLSPLTSKASRTKADTSRLHVRCGEYIASETEELMNQDELVRAACGEIVEHTRDRRSCLIFASGVNHGKNIKHVLENDHGVTAETVFGETPSSRRDEVLKNFCDGRLKYVINVNVLTTGFDAPNIDCIALVRPTLSPGLYYQMVGRGFRRHPDKNDCLVLDFGGNVLRHGPVDDIQVKEPKSNGSGDPPAKECPDCQALIAAGYARCPECGHQFPPPQRKQHAPKATDAPVLSGNITTKEYKVQSIKYSVYTKRGAEPDQPKTMRVDYQIGWKTYKSEWICFEHNGYARRKAVAWWRKRSNALVPETAEEAVLNADDAALAVTNTITVRSIEGDYDRIVDHDLGDIPYWREPGWDDVDEGWENPVTDENTTLFEKAPF